MISVKYNPATGWKVIDCIWDRRLLYFIIVMLYDMQKSDKKLHPLEIAFHFRKDDGGCCLPKVIIDSSLTCAVVLPPEEGARHWRYCRQRQAGDVILHPPLSKN